MKKIIISLMTGCLSLSMFHLPIKATTILSAEFVQDYVKVNDTLTLQVENASSDVHYEWSVDDEVISNDDCLLIDETMQNKIIEVSVSDQDDVITQTMMVSNLPVLFIDTENNVGITSKEDYVNATMRIQTNELYPNLYNDSQGYDGAIEIRGRGNATWTWAKKPYKIKLDKKANLFGMGKNKHWVLLANYLDSSLMRNKLSYDLSNKLGMEYMQSTWVEVVLNGQKIGNYQLCEQVRVDSTRIDIYDWESTYEDVAAAICEANNLSDDDLKALEDLMEEDYGWIDSDSITYNNVTYKVSDYFDYPDLSGGYLFELDGYWDEISKFKTEDGHPINFKNPEFAATSNLMYEAGKEIIQQVEDATTSESFTTLIDGEIYHYQDLVDLDSLISFWLINEIFFNADFMCQSNYMYKPHDSKLIMGPIWDMDWSSGSAGDIAATNKWQTYTFGFNYGDRAQDRQWYRYLCKDPFYVLKAKETYDEIQYELNQIIKEQGLLQQYYDYLKTSGALDTEIWSNDRNATPFEENYTTLKTWLKARIRWLDNQFASKDSILLNLANYQETNLNLAITNNGQNLIQDENDTIYLMNEDIITISLDKITPTTMKLNGRVVYDNVNDQSFIFSKDQLNELSNKLNVVEVITSEGKDIICFKSIDSIDTSLLEAVIVEAKTYKASDWGSICFNNLQEAIQNAETFLASEITSQSEVNNHKQLLQEAILALTIYEVDPKQLINKDKNTVIEIVDYSTHATNDEPEYVLDYDGTTYWHSDYTNPNEELPQYITVDLKEEYCVDAITFLPRQDVDNGNGDIFEMKVYGSFDPYEDFVLIDTYSFEYSGKNLIDRDQFKYVDLKDTQLRYLKIEVTNAGGDGNSYKYCSMGELRVYGVLSNETKALLVEKLQEAKQYDEYDYDDASFKALTDAIVQGDSIVANSNASQNDIDDALASLITAINNLKSYENTGVDKRLLKQALKATNYDEINYLASSWQAYQDALAIGQRVYDSELASQDEIDQAVLNINQAIKNLIIKAGNGYKNLAHLINTNANTEIEVIDFSSECGNGGTDEGSAGGEAYRVLDYDNKTYWHTDWKNHNPDLGYLVFDLKQDYTLTYLQFLPRQDITNGDLMQIKIYISEDENFSNNEVIDTYTYESNASGNGLLNRDWNYAYLNNQSGRYIKVEGIKTGGTSGMNAYATMSEIRFFGISNQTLADKTALDEAIQQAQAITSSNYTSTSFNHLTSALQQAQKLYDQIDASQEQVDQATATLMDAINNLVEKANKASLLTLINETKNLDASLYTTSSYDALLQVLDSAQIILDNEEATQNEVDATTKALTDAVAALVKKPTTPLMNYKDVQDQSAWFYRVVEKAYQKGLMQATGKVDQNDPNAKFFEPDAPITRAMVATVLYRMAGMPAVDGDKVFPDVDPALWYGKAIEWAADHKVVSGFADGTFGPDKEISRQDLAIMLRNYASKAGLDTSKQADLTSFLDDDKVDSYALSAVAWCVQAGLMSGQKTTEGNLLNPKNNASRAECAKMFTLLHDLLIK